jgi:hypothetical protein
LFSVPEKAAVCVIYEGRIPVNKRDAPLIELNRRRERATGTHQLPAPDVNLGERVRGVVPMSVHSAAFWAVDITRGEIDEPARTVGFGFVGSHIPVNTVGLIPRE